jgi:hypothetical protein
VDRKIIHLPLSVGGTLLIVAPISQRQQYTEAIALYQEHAPGNIVICEEAYEGTVEERWHVRQAERYHQQCTTPYTHRNVHCFSVHCVNIDEVPNRSLALFWRILGETLHDQHLSPPVPRPHSRLPDALGCLAAVVVGLTIVVGCAWVSTLLWRYFVK